MQKVALVGVDQAEPEQLVDKAVITGGVPRHQPSAAAARATRSARSRWRAAARSSTRATSAGSARSGEPEAKGGAGSYSIASWIASATARPAISAATVSATSIPAVTPPPVKRLPSTTTRSATGSAPKCVQQVARHPVGRRPPAAQQPRRTQHQRAGADADDIARPGRGTAQKRQHLVVFEQRVDAGAARHEDEIERRAIGKAGVGQDRQPVLGAHRVEIFPQQPRSRRRAAAPAPHRGRSGRAGSGSETPACRCAKGVPLIASARCRKKPPAMKPRLFTGRVDRGQTRRRPCL